MKQLISEALKQPVLVGITAALSVGVGIAAFRWPLATSTLVLLFCIVGIAVVSRR